MNKEEFKMILEENQYSYKEKGNKIIVDHDQNVYLTDLETLPEGIEFSNEGSVFLRYIQILPVGIEFSNRGSVFLRDTQILSEGIEFSNTGGVYLESLRKFSKGVRFKNYSVYSNSKGVEIVGDGVYFKKDLQDSINVPGIKIQRVLNCMIIQLYG
jgi:hypothetical protein